MIPIQRLNHAVLYVRDVERAAAFYREVFGFEDVQTLGRQAIFLRAAGSSNHHDLGLMAVGPDAPRPPRGSTGLYHLAWQVGSPQDLARAAEVLSNAGALTGASDHGSSRSLYGVDPDGNEFEVMWAVPPAEWPDGGQAYVAPLDLARDLERVAP